MSTSKEDFDRWLLQRYMIEKETLQKEIQELQDISIEVQKVINRKLHQISMKESTIKVLRNNLNLS